MMGTKIHHLRSLRSGRRVGHHAQKKVQLVKLHGSTICSDAYDHDDFSVPVGADLDAISNPTTEKKTIWSKQIHFSAVCKLSMRTVHFATTRL